MVNSLDCEVTGCTWASREGATLEQSIQLLTMHNKIKHTDIFGGPVDQTSSLVTRARPESLPRPAIAEGATEADFARFEDKWARYKRSTLAQATPQHVLDQLWACCSTELETSVYNTGANSNTAEKELMEAIKKLAVRRQNCLVNVTQFLDMAQDNEETAGRFMARLKGQASTCSFSLPCPAPDCTQTVIYTEQMVAHQLVRGLGDPVIQEQVLAQGAESGVMDLAKLIKFIEAKEAGKRSSLLLTTAGGLNRMSEYQRGKRSSSSLSTPLSPTPLSPTPPVTCTHCGSDKCKGKKECNARDKICSWCLVKNHFERVCSKKKKGEAKKVKEDQPTNAHISSLEVGAGSFCNLSLSSNVHSNFKKRTIGHHEYDSSKGCWIAKRAEPHPTITVSVSVCGDAYPALQLPPPRQLHLHATTSALADTGAQLTVAGPFLLRILGLSEQEMIPLSNEVRAANNQNLALLGGLFITLSGEDGEGNTRVSKQLCYISQHCSTLFLSKAACRDLGIVGKEFPSIGSDYFNSVANIGEQEQEEIKLSGYGSKTNLNPSKPKAHMKCEHDGEMTCVCPRRALAPDPPTVLPFPATEQNHEKLKQWIIQRYSSSAFNQCESQPLPLMTDTPPLKLYIDTNAEPVAIHKPRPVPIHFQAKVKAGLDRDCALGVLEKIRVGEPTTWCSPMVVTPKKNGEPRRVVDLQALNRVAVRQTHATMSPYHQAVSVPKGTYKTVTDAFEGYHSVPLRPSDTDYTVFLTPWGRYKYLTAPQGFLAAGDGYTARYDEIVKDFPDFTKCIDDTLLWADTLEDVFFRTCQYLTLCSRAGIIFNKKKFQFGSKTVDFLGFTITEDSVKPSADYIEAIKEFPRPKDITGIRSWFGLVNQVAFAFAQTRIMLPFRDLLKPSSKFIWTSELEDAFIKGKQAIIDAVIDGVRSYEIDRTTAICTDWSKFGLGFILLQKHCTCPGDITPVCCNQWKLVFAGSRFTSPAESRYHPGQGEALSVAWALHKARHYCLGNPNLVLAVDHKPLLKILGDKHLDEIEDPRMLNLKEKTLRYSFKIVHVPGRLHAGPDATSRSPVSKGAHLELTAITLASLTEQVQEVVDTTVRHLVAGLRQAPTTEEEENSLYLEQLALGEAYSCLAALTLTPGEEENLQCNLSALSSPQVISWSDISSAAAVDPLLPALATLISRGAPEDSALWPPELKLYFQHRQHLFITENTVVFKSRAVVPTALRPRLLDILHSGHQGCTGMLARASQSVWWPGMSGDIQRRREACRGCDAVAPSQPAAPPHPLPQPEYPFQMLTSDYFAHAGSSYFIINCRYSNFLSVYNGTPNSEDFIQVLREYFTNWGIADELATDEGTVFTSAATEKFLKQYGVKHRRSSVYFPHSNQHAEGSVKAAKRLIRENTATDGKLNSDQFVRALLQHRNTPDGSGSSPTQVVFGRSLKDFFPAKPASLLLHPEWKAILDKRELALSRRHSKRGKELAEHTKTLSTISPGQVVLVQNQHGNKPKRWDRTGLVIEVKEHDQYLVRMDGSGRATLRNRRFLRPTTPHSNQATPSLEICNPVQTTSPPPEPLVSLPSVPPPCPPAHRPLPTAVVPAEEPWWGQQEAREPLAPTQQEQEQEQGVEQVPEPTTLPRRSSRQRKPKQLAPGMLYYD